MFLDWTQYHSNKSTNVFLIYFTYFYLARINSKVLSWTQNWTDSVRVQKNELNPTRNTNPTQPNPYSSGWIGPGCRVECTPLLKLASLHCLINNKNDNNDSLWTKILQLVCAGLFSFQVGCQSTTFWRYGLRSKAVFGVFWARRHSCHYI